MSPEPAPAIEELIERHTDRAYAAAYRLTGNQADAWDLVQESFARALEKAGLYDPSFDFGGWLHRLLYRVYLNGRRGRGRRREISLEPSTEENAGPAGFQSADSVEMPEIALERSETQARIHEALDRLPDDQRAVLTLVDIEGQGYEQAAEVLDWPVGSVAGRLFRARRLMRECLKEGE
jgi:RNA polymerase sigma-70 factor (ECF subfamily)